MAFTAEPPKGQRDKSKMKKMKVAVRKRESDRRRVMERNKEERVTFSLGDFCRYKKYISKST